MVREPKLVDYAEGWDWLIVLDACRYDYFESVAYPMIRSRCPNAKLERRLSLGSETTAVLSKFPKLQSTVVITGHPFVLMRKDKFTRVIDAGFDYELSTCPPWFMERTFLKYYLLLLRFRRRVMWFLQPHHPFIGETKLNVRIFEGGRGSPMFGIQKQIPLYKRAKEEGILEKAYADNLKLVTEYLLRMLPKMRGKVVITSDHGDGLGKPLRPEDKPVFSHPGGRSEWELRLIPWCVVHVT